MSKTTEATTALASAAKAAGFDPTAKTFNSGTGMEVTNVYGAKTVGNGMASFSVRMYLAIGGALRFTGSGRTADGENTNFRKLADAVAWLEANTATAEPAEEATTPSLRIAVGDEVQFMAGPTPMTGTVLFAAGPDAAAVRLTSGAEVHILLSSITRVL